MDLLRKLRDKLLAPLLGYGILINELLAAAETLAEAGIQAEVLKLNQIAPLDREALAGYFTDTRCLLVLEDSMGAGCVGQRITAILAEAEALPPRVILKNMGRSFAPEGSVPELNRSFGLDAAAVAEAVRKAVDHGA